MALRTLILLALAAACAAGCGSAGTKAGAGTGTVLSMKMQAPDGDDADAAYFADEVRRRTAGRVRIEIDGHSYSSVDPDNELRLIRDLRAGRVATAYVPSRAWERAGLPGFRALQAPFLIDDYRLLKDVATGEVGARMLATLDKAGLVGLGLVPKELRRLLGKRSLASPRALAGARIRVVTSPTSVLDLEALGATPLTDLDAHQVSGALARGNLDGLETEVHAIPGNAYTSVAPYLTSNLPLFAKAQTIVVRRDVLERLSDADQHAVREAAKAAVEHADPQAQETTEVKGLCAAGLRLVAATQADVDAFRATAEPVIEQLAQDPVTARAIASIKALRGDGAARDTLPTCPPAQQGQTPAKHTEKFPQGRYESHLTKADFDAAGVDPDPQLPPDPLLITMRSGRWRTNEVEPFVGTYSVDGDELTFLIQAPPENKGTRETVKWSYYRGRLTLRSVFVADAGSRVIYDTHPWRRVGP